MLPYPVQSIQIGGKFFNSSYAFPCHVQAWHQFYCVLSGKIEMRVEDRIFLLTAGNALWLAPSLRREPRAASHSGRYLNVTFRSPWPHLGSGNGERVRLNAAGLAEAQRCSEFSASGQHEQSIAFHSLCLTVLGPSRFGLLPDTSQSTEAKESWLVSRVEALMGANVGTPIGLEELASLARISRATLGRVFQRYRGTSPIVRFHEIRLEHAMQLLRTTRLNITEVAFRTGFSSSQYFSTCFKRKFGMVATAVPREQILYIHRSGFERGRSRARL